MDRVHPLLSLSLLALSALGSGCSDPPFVGVLRTTDGTTAPTGGVGDVIWQLDDRTPPHDFVYGHMEVLEVELSATGEDVPGFAGDFESDPPAAALTEGLGVGRILFSAIGVPDGVLVSLSAASVGAFAATDRHAIIFKSTPSSGQSFGWASLFDTGYSCAELVQTGGQTAYVPIECTALQATVLDVETLPIARWGE